MAKIIVVHGFPGAGKSTNSARMAAEGFGGRPVVHASAGDRLRAIRSGAGVSEYGSFINSPEAPRPLPDDVVGGTLFELLHGDDEPQLALFDGYPRFEGSVDGFIYAVAERKHRLLGCISLNITLETSIARVSERSFRFSEQSKAENPDRSEAESLRSFAIERYREDFSTTQLAVKRLETLGVPIERMSAGGNRENTYRKFRAAVTRLALATS